MSVQHCEYDKEIMGTERFYSAHNIMHLHMGVNMSTFTPQIARKLSAWSVNYSGKLWWEKMLVNLTNRWSISKGFSFRYMHDICVLL